MRFLWENPSTKVKEVYCRLVLKNAKVVKYGQHVVYRGNHEYAHLEEVGFIFESVDMWWDPDSIFERVIW